MLCNHRWSLLRRLIMGLPEMIFRLTLITIQISVRILSITRFNERGKAGHLTMGVWVCGRVTIDLQQTCVDPCPKRRKIKHFNINPILSCKIRILRWLPWIFCCMKIAMIYSLSAHQCQEILGISVGNPTRQSTDFISRHFSQSRNSSCACFSQSVRWMRSDQATVWLD